MARRFRVLLEWDSAARLWVTFVLSLDSLSTHGGTREEALEQTRDAILGYLEAAERQGPRHPRRGDRSGSRRARGRHALSSLPSLSGRRLVSAHHYLRRPTGSRLVVVPVHGNCDLPVGTLRSVLRQAELTREGLLGLL